ncbi:condensation domain-containing protein, partial [Dactylosporangium darangshiense]|uniref:condensation domain-containing protein n=1 Tax=Dactylosporangium darangshiense TaxID=579108 RepID=UPI0031EE90C7
MLSEAKRELLQRRLRGEAVTAPKRMERPDGPIPLAYAQERMWFLAQLDPETAEYNTTLNIPFDGPLDVTALTSAVDVIMERHEALRTRIVADADGVPHQVIDPVRPFPLRPVDVADQPDPRRAAHELIAADWRTPFDLAAGPLVRGLLIHLADDQHLLSLIMHHVVTDEWSNRIIRQELLAVYEAELGGRPSPLAPLKMQYADYAILQRKTLVGDAMERQLAYWRDLLHDPPILDLPVDHPRPPVRVPIGAVQRFRVPADVVAGLREASRRADATMFMTLLTVYAVLLNRYSGQDDVLIGTPIANRSGADTERIVGFLVNTLVVRFDLSDDPTFGELLERTRRQTLASYTYQDAPFPLIVEQVVHERDRSRQPLNQTFFNYYGYDAARYQRSGSAAELPDSDIQMLDGVPVQWDIRLIFTENVDDIDGVVEYTTALYDHTTITRAIGHLRALLAAVAADAERPVSRLPLLTTAETAQLTQWNDTAVALPVVGSVLDLIDFDRDATAVR